MKQPIFVTLVFALAFAAAPASAQQFYDIHQSEVSIGYSYMDSDIGMHGWKAEYMYRANQWLGIVADFSGHYGSDDIFTVPVDSDAHNFLFGPRVVWRLEDREQWRPFGHFLLGASRLSAETAGMDVSDTSFAWALGGGIDYMFSERLGARVVQADYLRTNFGGTGQNNARLTFGLVFRFGPSL